MLGVFYVIWALFSNAVAVIKEANHNIHAKVNPRTNTFVNYSGNLVDANNGKLRFWGKEPNGDEVLRNKKFKIVRNLSEEERARAYNEAKSCPNGQIAINTKEKREVRFLNGFTDVHTYATVFKDIETGEEYYRTRMITDKRNHLPFEFYIKASDPNTLVCISDSQRNIEMSKKEKHLYNWITFPDDEYKFIKENNEKKLSYKSGRILIYEIY